MPNLSKFISNNYLLSNIIEFVMVGWFLRQKQSSLCSIMKRGSITKIRPLVPFKKIAALH